MKREELKYFYATDGEVGTMPLLHNCFVYPQEDVDHLLDEKDAEIAELKKKLMPCLNGDCILTCEVVEKYGKENAELKAKLESVQESAYADSVDAGMRERRLRRALYKTLAMWANERAVLTWSWQRHHGWLKMKRKCLEKAEEYR